MFTLHIRKQSGSNISPYLPSYEVSSSHVPMCLPMLDLAQIIAMVFDTNFYMMNGTKTERHANID